LKHLDYKIAIIIPIFNGLIYTKKTLGWLFDSIGRCSEKSCDIKVIIVDDGSTDYSGLWVQEHYPQVHILRGDGNLWWSGAMNLGAQHAIQEIGCDYIVCWNNDIKCDPAYFPNLIQILQGPSDVRLLGSKLYLLEPPDVIFQMGCYFDPKKGKHTFIGSMQQDSHRFEKPFEPDWASGMGTIIHSSVFDKIGFWDNRRFPQYHGDSDFCLRAKKAGFRLTIHPELKIWNDKTSSGMPHHNNLRTFLKTFTSLKSNYYVRSQVLFYLRHAESKLAYLQLLRMYIVYLGSFIERKVKSFFY
jgi:GT2 family glycosyltransferase